MASKTLLRIATFSLLVVLTTVVCHAQSRPVTDDNLSESIENAKTPADHEAIAAYYDQEAASMKEKADLHRRAAETYRKMQIDKPVGMATMCDATASMWDKGSADAKKLANDHHQMAKAGGNGQQ